MNPKVKNLALLFIGFLILFVMVIYIGPIGIGKVIKAMDKKLLILAVLISIIAILISIIRWNLFLNIDVKDLAIPLIIGHFVNNVTPGKCIGEPLRSFLVARKKGMQHEKVLVSVVLDRITDTLTLVFLTSGGIFTMNLRKGIIVIPTTLILILILIFLCTNEKYGIKLLEVFGKRISLDQYSIEKAYKNFKNDFVSFLKNKKIMFTAFIFSLVVWILEALKFDIILKAARVNIAFLSAMFIYFLSVTLAPLTLIPGGLGSTEVFMTSLLTLSGISPAKALAAVLLDRLMTHWFIIVTGAIASLYCTKK